MIRMHKLLLFPLLLVLSVTVRAEMTFGPGPEGTGQLDSAGHPAASLASLDPAYPLPFLEQTGSLSAPHRRQPNRAPRTGLALVVAASGAAASLPAGRNIPAAAASCTAASGHSDGTGYPESFPTGQPPLFPAAGHSLPHSGYWLLPADRPATPFLHPSPGAAGHPARRHTDCRSTCPRAGMPRSRPHSLQGLPSRDCLRSPAGAFLPQCSAHSGFALL